MHGFVWRTVLSENYKEWRIRVNLHETGDENDANESLLCALQEVLEVRSSQNMMFCETV